MLYYERKLCQDGYKSIAGIDEAGVGPWAGPVVAGAVILKDLFFKAKICDSKRLSPKKRILAYEEIQGKAYVGTGVVSVREIDEENIFNATRMAMEKAIDNLPLKPDYLLVDGRIAPRVPCPRKNLSNGEDKSLSIACASIVAKVTRDRLMLEYDRVYPGYDFARHKGYGTRIHREGLLRLGPSPIHRKSFAPVKKLT